VNSWIKFEKDTANDPRLFDAAAKLSERYVIAAVTARGGTDLSHSELLHFCCNALRGALVTLFTYADTHIRGDDTLPTTLKAIDSIVHIEGFCELMPDEWVRELDERTVILPGYCKHNSLIAKKKAKIKSKKRVRAFRAKKKLHRNAPVTALPERLGTVAEMVDQDQRPDKEKKNEQKKEAAPPIADGFDPKSVHNLDQTAWARWVAYRIALKKPLRPVSLQAAAELMAKLGGAQAAAVQHTIAMGWTGLREPDPPKPNGKHALQLLERPPPTPMTPEEREKIAGWVERKRLQGEYRAACDLMSIYPIELKVPGWYDQVEQCWANPAGACQ
jgi:hypothetical protein